MLQFITLDYYEIFSSEAHQHGDVKRNSSVSVVSGGKEESAMQMQNNNTTDDSTRTGGGMGVCGGILLWVSWCLFLVTLPFSLLVCFKVKLKS